MFVSFTFSLSVLSCDHKKQTKEININLVFHTAELMVRHIKWVDVCVSLYLKIISLVLVVFNVTAYANPIFLHCYPILNAFHRLYRMLPRIFEKKCLKLTEISWMEGKHLNKCLVDCGIFKPVCQVCLPQYL